jgi:hypothetical protein
LREPRDPSKLPQKRSKLTQEETEPDGARLIRLLRASFSAMFDVE